MTLEDATLGRSRPLLQLPGGGIAAHRAFECLHLVRTKAVRPQELSMLIPRIGPADHGRARRTFILCGQTQVLVATLHKHVTRKIGLVDALHDDHLGSGLRIVQARAHHLVPPLEDSAPYQFALGIVYVVGIIHDDSVATFSGGCTTD